jgi:hypothetical protein
LANRSECKIFPGDITFAKQTDFEAFDAWSEVEVEQSGTIKQMNLFDVWDVDHWKRGTELDVGSGLFDRFAAGAFTGGLTKLEKSGR